MGDMKPESEIQDGYLTAAAVTIYSQVPENALTADLLGTERSGHGIRIREDGLVVTVGYLVMEAAQVWITSCAGKTSPAYVVAEDYDSGLALLRPTLPIGDQALVPCGCMDLDAGDELRISRYGSDAVLHCQLIAKREFAGRWEYLLDEALFTAPACSDWAGAGLLDETGKLCGIGSLLMEVSVGAGQSMECNMFIPMELITPHIEEMCRHGRRQGPPRPWLGSLIQEYQGKLVVVGIYNGCPAHRAGIEPGDIVVSVNDEPVTSLPEMLRKVWSLGSAGVDVPLTVTGSGSVRKCLVKSMDRSAFHLRHAAETVN